jgi:hypothetical protein
MTGLILYHLTGCVLGVPIVEQRNTFKSAVDRLDELSAAANDIAEGCPSVRMARTPRFQLTDAPVPELLDTRTGETLVKIEEQKIP